MNAAFAAPGTAQPPSRPSIWKDNLFSRQRLAGAKARTVPEAERTPRQRLLIARDVARLAARNRGLEAFLRWAERELGRRERRAAEAWSCLADDFFTKRGISPGVRFSRPYGSWTADNPQPLREAWDPFVSRGQRGWITRIAKQSDGILIPRYTPPGLGLPPISAEIRPLEPVETRPEYYQRDRQARGLERKSAKYIHCPTPTENREYWHDHADMKPEHRAKHIKRKHGSSDVRGPHPHTYKHKDRRKGQGRRIDVHPRAVPLFEEAKRVFFGIEGCPKADAILSQGEAVFSVPSVGQWDAPELQAFAEMYLAGKTTIVVPDADWHANPDVLTQALLCRSFLRRFGLEAVVAAPPAEAGYKGVDDFLGAGGSLDDLVVIGREMPDAFDQWVQDQRGRSDGLSRDANVLQNVALHAADDGTIRKDVRMLAKIMDTHPMTVSRGIASLAERGAIAIEGSLVTRPPTRKRGTGGRWYRTEEDWEERPTIIVREELRAVELEPVRLGDLDSGVPRQFATRDMNELYELVRQSRGGGGPVRVPAVGT